MKPNLKRASETCSIPNRGLQGGRETVRNRFNPCRHLPPVVLRIEFSPSSWRFILGAGFARPAADVWPGLPCPRHSQPVYCRAWTLHSSLLHLPHLIGNE